MKRRIHHSRGETQNDFHGAAEEGKLSNDQDAVPQDTSQKKSNPTSLKSYLSYVPFLIGILVLAIWLIQRRSPIASDGDQNFGDKNVLEMENALPNAEDTSMKNLNADKGMSIFDRCNYPSGKVRASSSMCTYFRPVRFFEKGQPGYPYRSVLSSYKEASTKLRSNSVSHDRASTTMFSRWAWQVNNWPKGGGPRLKLSVKSKIQRPNTVESVTAFATPKVGSRTQWSLFLDHIAIPKKPIQKGRRVAAVNSTYVANLLQRQTTESQQPGASRRNIVFAVVRNPVERFISSMGEVVNLRDSSRCIDCDKYFTKPCLFDDGGLPITSAPDVILCTLQSIKTNGFFNEHFVPHAMFLTKLLHNSDIEIAVFPIEHLDDIVSEFGVEKAIRSNPRTRKNVKAGDSTGLVESFSSIIKDDSSANEKVIREICSVYAVDVAIMRYLGFPVKYCDDVDVKN
mmetsp:Transcript_6447/g.9128  ORF Transcript_6447/g.9128 Transcript_6447/m.9128 type:complete len:455 (-) Transcript_6447:43-1407(-)